MHAPTTRRQFLKQGALLAASAGLFNIAHANPRPGPLKVAVVGCGKRGALAGNGGALGNFIAAAKLLGHEVEIAALADAFPASAAKAAARWEVPSNRVIVGLDAYRKVMETDANFVILTTPPVFRPLHLEAAIAAGKHAFIEKPVAVDPVGARRVIELGEVARAKHLGIVAGTQRRHDAGYLRNKARIDAGAIGPILGGTVSWNGHLPWLVRRRPEHTNRDYLLKNWLNFTELSGDHICEQHVHNIDVANWFIGRPPVAAIGFGGRARRETGNQFDFFSVDFDYGDGVHIHSQCRQISGCYARQGEFFRGAEGQVYGGGRLSGRDVSIPEIRVQSDNPMVQEHVDLISSVLSGRPENRAREVAEATMTAIMGRISAYDVMENTQSPFFHLALSPGALDFESSADLPVPPEVAPVPGDGAPVQERS